MSKKMQDEQRKKMEIEILYNDYYDRVFKEIYYKVNKHKEIAEDLSSHVFLKILNNYDSFDSTKASIRTWIMCITRNTIIDYYRRQKKEPILLEDLENHEDLIVDFEEQFITFGERRTQGVRSLLQQLKVQDREIIIMKYYHNKTNREIARQTGTNESTVSSRFFRLLRKMKKQISNIYG